jgi:ribose-phosphate pyrophosphokinase
VATHGIFCEDALDRLRASGAIERVVCTDTHPRAVALRGDFLEVKSVAPLLAEYLEESMARKSIEIHALRVP